MKISLYLRTNAAHQFHITQKLDHFRAFTSGTTSERNVVISGNHEASEKQTKLTAFCAI